MVTPQKSESKNSKLNKLERFRLGLVRLGKNGALSLTGPPSALLARFTLVGLQNINPFPT